MQHPQAPSTIEQRIFERVMALLDEPGAPVTKLAAWHRAVFTKTLLSGRQGSLSPATLPLKLRHAAAEQELLEDVATVCACFHSAADLADDCEDDDLPPETWATDERAHAINVSSGLLFLVYQAIDRLPIEAKERRAMLREFTQAGWRMHIGQYMDLDATNRIRPADHRQIAKLKTGTELSAFFAAGALALGRPAEPYRRFGEAFGCLIQAISDVIDVWLKEESSDAIVGKQGLPIAEGLASGNPGIRTALAGNRRGVDHQRRIRQMLCHPDILAAWRRQAEAQGNAMMSALRAMTAEPELAELATGVLAQASELADALDAAAPQLRRTSRRGTAPLTRPATDQAKAFLADHAPSYREAWDIHRWGLFGQPEVIGDVFGPAVIADILAEAGEDTSAIVQHVLSRQDADGWRFYPGHFSIPCDADDLGQIITLLHRSGLRGEALQQAVASASAHALKCARKASRLPVWLYGPLVVVGEGSWPGDRCPGAVGNGISGLSLLDDPDWQPILAVATAELLDAVGTDGLWRGYSYPEPYLCTALVVRGLTAQRDRVDQALRQRIDQALDGVRTHLESSQRLDGGWGSPQASAAALTTWLALDPHPVGKAAAVTFLEDSQLPDGSWGIEPFYVTCGPEDPPPSFSSRLVTTAICLRALVRAGKPMNHSFPAPARAVAPLALP